jgi:limonene 1,2-monooxygenase
MTAMTTATERLRFGAFIPPYVLPTVSPTVSYQRIRESIELLDRSGFDEIWLGEHHSGGVEIVGCPELFLAAVAERTRHLRLGTGVNSVPYHNPFTLAARLAQLDHQTYGRAMMGLGPGALASDAHMLGVPVAEQRRRMEDASGVIKRLLDGESVTASSEWYSLNEARLQMTRFNEDSLEIVTAAAVSPNGPKVAGRYGFGMLNLAASSPAGFAALGEHWSIAEAEATHYGQTVSRDRWRLMGFIHIAPTMEQAIEDVKYGLPTIWKYLSQVSVLGPVHATSTEQLVDDVNEMGAALVGTPEMAIDKIRSLQVQSGGFGTFLLGIADFADHEATLRSLRLFADVVIPRFNGRGGPILESHKWVLNQHGETGAGATVFKDQTLEAIERARQDYNQERAARY